MGATVFYAPLHVIPGKPALGNYSNNPDMAPSLKWGGGGLLDPRYTYLTGNRKDGQGGVVAPQILGFVQSGFIKTVSQVPSTLSTNNIAGAQTAAQGIAMTLANATGNGITVLGAATLWLPSLVTMPVGMPIIDGVQSFKKFGLGFQSWFYDPSNGVSRAVSITGVSGGTGGNFLITGIDYYGYTQTQLLTVAAGVNTVNTTKCFKGIYEVVPQFTDAHNYSVGTADIYDLDLMSESFGDVLIYWNGVLQTLSTFTAGVTTNPATNLTGSPRGTFTPGSSSNNTIKLEIFVSPSPGRLATTPMSQGLFGVPPA